MIFQQHLLSFIGAVAGLFVGLVLVDVDHLFSRLIFHWYPLVLFFLFLGIGLFIHVLILDPPYYGDECYKKYMVELGYHKPLTIKEIWEVIKSKHGGG